jgi:hypothetical protein
MKYADLLKCYEWKEFREDYIEYRRNSDGASVCDDCGEDFKGTLHVHHKVYRLGVLPWEYDFSELRLLCPNCHDLLHETEQSWRNFIRSLPPHVCYEAMDLLNELRLIQKPQLIKSALARAKVWIRELFNE